MQTDYKTKLDKIKNITKIKISKTDYDLAKLQGRDISEIEGERLISERNQKVKELNKDFGIEEPKTKEKELPKIPENKNKRIWDLLQGKGLIDDGRLQDKV